MEQRTWRAEDEGDFIMVRMMDPDMVDALTDYGERVVHLRPDHVYYAHLSIYDFAVPMVQRCAVLDAGSGTGYGAAHLADSGAREVHALDSDEAAIAFSREQFARSNLFFQAMDLEWLSSFAGESFDVVFSSNTMEHIPDIAAFLDGACDLLTVEGVLIAAVPPITNDRLVRANIANPYHVHIWTPAQWLHMLLRYFQEVQPYAHGFGQIGQSLDCAPGSAIPANISEQSFVFAPVSADALEYRDDPQYDPTLTAIFVARRPRAPELRPGQGEPLTFVDHSFTRTGGGPAPQERWLQRVDSLEPLVVQHEEERRQTLAYVRLLEETLAGKNRHIAHLEQTIQRLEQGRVMRLLRWLK